MLAVFQVKSFFGGLCFLIAFAAGVMALADPRGGNRLVEDDRSGMDVVFVLDVSRSMLAGDEEPDRLGRAKTLVAEVADALPGARFSLVVFKGEAFRPLPLTADRYALDLALEAATPARTPSR